jgi:hypothetical protein
MNPKLSFAKAAAPIAKRRWSAFANGRHFIAGNKCDKGAGSKKEDLGLNLYAYKYEKLYALPRLFLPRGKVGLPVVAWP